MITQSLFIRARAAAITTSMIYFGTSLLNSFVRDSYYPTKGMKMFCCLSPTVAMIQTFGCLGEFEASRAGNRMDNIFS